MCSQTELVQLFKVFTASYFTEEISVEDTLKKLSFDEQNNVYVFDDKIDTVAISLDSVAHYPYRISRFKGSNMISDSIKSIDAFIISRDKEWYFIEFKNCSIKSSKIKDNINLKGYQTWHMIMDILSEVRNEGVSILPEFYSDPIKYAKEHVTYILVFNSEKDPYSTGRVSDSELAKEHYQPEYMMKIEKYLFKSAYAITERELAKMVRKGMLASA